MDIKFKTLLSIWGLFIFCLVACYATGYVQNIEEVYFYYVLGSVAAVILFLRIADGHPLVASRLFLFYVCSVTLYFPIGWLYGSPTYKIVGSLLETNLNEAAEFLHTIPISVYLLQAIFFILGLVTWKYVSRVFLRVGYWRKEKKIVLSVLLPIALSFSIVGNMLVDEEFNETTLVIPVNIIGFYYDLVSAPSQYFSKRQVVLEQAKKPSSWHIRKVAPKYKNYVLVIGESARSDYMNAYGFPLENTPFLSRTKGLLIDGYISAAETTIESLPKTLSLPQQSQNNIVSLAKQSGFQTAWLSNQGMLGFFANEISAYAVRSDYPWFTQRGDFRKSVPMSDRLLLPQMERVLKTDSEGRSRLIVLHLMGSHNDFCKRLDRDAERFVYQTEKLSCYVATIAQTDRLLKDVVKILDGKQESWSLVYFSDHGLKHTGRGAERTMIHGGDTRQSFTVPLVKISSDDTQHKIVKVQRSAFNFLRGFSYWTGIQTDELSVDGYDFFSGEPDLPSGSNNLDKVNRLPDDFIK